MSEDKITKADIEAIIQIVASNEHLVDFHLKYGDVEVHLSREGGRGASAAAPPPAQAPTPAAVQPRESPPAPRAPAPAEPPEAQAASRGAGGGRASVPAGMRAIEAPMVGTFYRASAPGAKPFVETGDRVERETVVCIIEVMKLMNSIRAGVSGTVREIRVENGEPVEFRQVLLVIEPD